MQPEAGAELDTAQTERMRLPVQEVLRVAVGVVLPDQVEMVLHRVEPAGKVTEEIIRDPRLVRPVAPEAVTGLVMEEPDHSRFPIFMDVPEPIKPDMEVLAVEAVEMETVHPHTAAAEEEDIPEELDKPEAVQVVVAVVPITLEAINQPLVTTRGMVM